jgi:hypothetical protein
MVHMASVQFVPIAITLFAGGFTNIFVHSSPCLCVFAKRCKATSVTICLGGMARTRELELVLAKGTLGEPQLEYHLMRGKRPSVIGIRLSVLLKDYLCTSYLQSLCSCY